MDGLSAAASVIAVLQAVGAIPGIIETFRTLIHISDEIKALANELTTLQALQDHLKSQVDLLSSSDPRLQVLEPKMLQLARTTLAQLINDLQALEARFRNTKRRRFRFVWDRSKIAQMAARARAAREALMLAMQDLSLVLMNKIDDPFLDIFTIGSLLTDEDADLSNQHASTISMQASVYSSPTTCPQCCSCRCHLSSTLRTPSWLQPVLGSVFLSYSCTPLLGVRSCDQVDCVRASSRVDLTYYFPTRVLKRALCLSIEVGGSFGHGAGLHVGVPRVFSNHDETWGTVNFGGADDLKKVWAQRPGTYSPLDVNESGMMQCRERTQRRRCFSSMHGGYVGQQHRVTALHAAIQSFSSISSLLSASPLPDLHQLDFLGRTPLIHASRINNLSAVKLLLRAGAGGKHIDDRDALGQTALLAALVGGHIRVALALLNAGCAVRVSNDVGRTPLHAIFRTWDSWNPHPDAAEVLARLVQGGDVRARSSYGYTPLHYLHTPLGKWRERVRSRKLEGTTVSIREETAAFETLLRHIRDRQLQEDDRTKRSPWLEDQNHWRELQITTFPSLWPGYSE
ncbi:hypothetical protein F5Y16DRAFT_418075 [Xylariaceae sp. FL0255]|nr:hypothetical protein F5Y16DRAFT_418075 [Xylariaceae sp. FL0255]